MLLCLGVLEAIGGERGGVSMQPQPSNLIVLQMKETALLVHVQKAIVLSCSNVKQQESCSAHLLLSVCTYPLIGRSCSMP